MKGFDKDKIYILYQDAFKEGLNFVYTNYKAYKPDPWDNKFHNNVLKIEKHYHTGITSSSTSAQKPVNYSHYLKENGEFLQFHSWKKLREYILTSEPFLKHFQIGKYSPYLNETRQKWEESLTIEYKIAQFIDHYIHKFRSKIFNEKKFKLLFDNWFNSINRKKLSYEIWVPIIYTSFEINSFNISDTICIKRISEDLQISRQLFIQSDISLKGAKELLISSCSHAIVISGNHFNDISNNASIYQSYNKLLDNDKFNLEMNNIIGSIRIVTGINIGYYQVFAKPVDWSIDWTAKYESVMTIYGDSYPPEYENYHWNKKPDSVSKRQLNKIKKVFKSVSINSNKKLTISIQKFNSVITRKKSDDIIFDIAVALESILSHDSKSETTFRLSTRGSYICILRKFDDYNPYEIKLLLTKLYDFRSAVAHGKGRKVIEKSENIDIKRKKVNLLDFGISFLRHCIEFLIDNKDYNDLNKLDEKILKDTYSNLKMQKRNKKFVQI